MSPLRNTPSLNPETFPEYMETGPTHVWIEPTNKCNARCTHCWHYYKEFGEDMSAALYEKIQAAVMDGLKRVELIGYGEPLIAPLFDRMFEDCAQRNIQIFFTTNGIKLADKKLLRKLAREDLIISLSIEGAREETHRFVRPFVKWDHMLKVLQNIKEVQEELGDACRMEVRFNVVVMRQNVADLPDLVKMAKEYGIKGINLFSLGGEENFEIVNGQAVRNEPEPAAKALRATLREASRWGIDLQLPAYFRHLALEGGGRESGLLEKPARWLRKAQLGINLAKRRGWKRLVEIGFHGFEPRPKMGLRFCLMPWQDSYFGSEGQVHPCCNACHELGNMAHQEWEEIWNGSPYRSLRRTIHGWNPTALCRYCTLPMGITGGDESYYTRFFENYREEKIALRDIRIEWGRGICKEEDHPDGGIYRWLQKRAEITLPAFPQADLLRLVIMAKSPTGEINPGKMRLNGGDWEHFDTSCPLLHIEPTAEQKKAPEWKLEIEMEQDWQIEPDLRKLALGLREMAILKHKKGK